ncbi:MAG TPA: HAMP domain-containing protein, partial [Candidatus Limnocylindria bacterium]|nr:HAMP domain-containing protein [Candidatus Limnocylindria bacterium]
MKSLRTQITLVLVLGSLLAAGVVVVAVQLFSMERMSQLLMLGVRDAAEADAMVQQYVGSVVAIGAVVGVLVGGVVAWWLARRILRPLQRLSEGTRRIAAGDLTARVAVPPDAELADVADSFNRMAATLERVEQLRRALVEDVAHELRTPLTTLRGYTEAMADGVVQPTPEMLRTVHAEIERLTRLVEALDSLARDEARAREQAMAEVQLGEVVRRGLALADPALRARDISVRIEEPEVLPTLHADPDGIGQVISNLVQNAVDYTTDGGEVVARLIADGGGVRCEIANTGPDIPPDQLPLIWERLHRADPSRSRSTGG